MSVAVVYCIVFVDIVCLLCCILKLRRVFEHRVYLYNSVLKKCIKFPMGMRRILWK